MRNFSFAAAAALCASAAAPASAVVYGGVDFPAGAISFADRVVSYDPNRNNRPPDPAYQGAVNALGVPDFAGADTCATATACTFVSLGGGGRLVLQFVDNLLTGSGTSEADLYIFEVGSAVEPSTVEVSADGIVYTSVGTAPGGTTGIDLDAFGFGRSARLGYVRLTSLTSTFGSSAGPDIDAVGAFSTVAAVPEPATWGFMIGGFALIGATLRTRRRSVRVRFGSGNLA